MKTLELRHTVFGGRFWDAHVLLFLIHLEQMHGLNMTKSQIKSTQVVYTLMHIMTYSELLCECQPKDWTTNSLDMLKCTLITLLNMAGTNYTGFKDIINVNLKDVILAHNKVMLFDLSEVSVRYILAVQHMTGKPWLIQNRLKPAFNAVQYLRDACRP